MDLCFQWPYEPVFALTSKTPIQRRGQGLFHFLPGPRTTPLLDHVTMTPTPYKLRGRVHSLKDRDLFDICLAHVSEAPIRCRKWVRRKGISPLAGCQCLKFLAERTAHHERVTMAKCLVRLYRLTTTERDERIMKVIADGSAKRYTFVNIVSKDEVEHTNVLNGVALCKFSFGYLADFRLHRWNNLRKNIKLGTMPSYGRKSHHDGTVGATWEPDLLNFFRSSKQWNLGKRTNTSKRDVYRLFCNQRGWNVCRTTNGGTSASPIAKVVRPICSLSTFERHWLHFFPHIKVGVADNEGHEDKVPNRFLDRSRIKNIDSTAAVTTPVVADECNRDKEHEMKNGLSPMSRMTVTPSPTKHAPIVSSPRRIKQQVISKNSSSKDFENQKINKYNRHTHPSTTSCIGGQAVGGSTGKEIDNSVNDADDTDDEEEVELCVAAFRPRNSIKNQPAKCVDTIWWPALCFNSAVHLMEHVRAQNGRNTAVPESKSTKTLKKLAKHIFQQELQHEAGSPYRERDKMIAFLGRPDEYVLKRKTKTVHAETDDTVKLLREQALSRTFGQFMDSQSVGDRQLLYKQYYKAINQYEQRRSRWG